VLVDLGRLAILVRAQRIERGLDVGDAAIVVELVPRHGVAEIAVVEPNERTRVEHGDPLMQIQQQLSDARVRELQARVGYNKAVSAYHRAIGDLLDVHNIKVEEPAVNDPQFFSSFDRYNWLNYGNRLNLQEKTNDSQPR